MGPYLPEDPQLPHSFPWWVCKMRQPQWDVWETRDCLVRFQPPPEASTSLSLFSAIFPSVQLLSADGGGDRHSILFVLPWLWSLQERVAFMVYVLIAPYGDLTPRSGMTTWWFRILVKICKIHEASLQHTIFYLLPLLVCPADPVHWDLLIALDRHAECHKRNRQTQRGTEREGEGVLKYGVCVSVYVCACTCMIIYWLEWGYLCPNISSEMRDSVKMIFPFFLKKWVCMKTHFVLTVMKRESIM